MIEVLDKFGAKRIVVIGDLMLDKYIYGDVSRISPEAPVPVVNVKEEKYFPGGAANVASNIAALSAKALLVGVVGDDPAHQILIKELRSRGIATEGIFVDNSRPTIQKVRIVGQHQQLVRVDYEMKDSIPKDVKLKMLAYMRHIIQDVDAVVVSDYNKGIVSRGFISDLLNIARKSRKIIVVDPKPSNALFFRNVSIISPNHKEASEIAGIEERNEKDLVRIGKRIVKMLSSNVLITRGEKGISLFEKNGKVTHIPTRAREVFDVTGAGDTACGALTLAMAAGASLKDATVISNHAAGIVVGKLGTSTVSVDELRKDLQSS